MGHPGQWTCTFCQCENNTGFLGTRQTGVPSIISNQYLCNVRYAFPVERANFPDEWKQKVKTTTDNQGGRNTGGRSGQQRGGNRHSQGTGQASSILRREFGEAQWLVVRGAKDSLPSSHRGHGGPIRGVHTRGVNRKGGQVHWVGNSLQVTGAWVGAMKVTQKSRP